MKAEDEASRPGANRMALDVKVSNRDATRLYSWIGYSVVGEPRKITASNETCTFSRTLKVIPCVLRINVTAG